VLRFGCLCGFAASKNFQRFLLDNFLGEVMRQNVKEGTKRTLVVRAHLRN